MIVSENEAKNMWCPHVGRDSFRENECIANQCMAWRWHVDPELVPHLKEMWRESAPEDQQHEADEIVALGYCGLSGKPKDSNT